MWPTCSRSKHPFARAMVCPAARSAATRRNSSSRWSVSPTGSRARARRPPVAADRQHGPQLVTTHGGRAALHHDKASRVVRQVRSRLEAAAGRKRERNGRHNRIAGAGHVHNRISPENRDVHGGRIGNEEGHPTAAARDEHCLHLRALDDLASCALERRRSEEHTSELQSQSNLVCRLLLEKKKQKNE